MIKKRVAVVKCSNYEVLSVVKALQHQVDFTLIGDEEKTKTLASEMDISLDNVVIINETFDVSACKIGANLAYEKKIDILMKGLVHTGTFMKAVLSKKLHLLDESSSLISLVSRFNLPGYHKPLFITDAGINMYPDIDQKYEIIKNAVSVAISLGVKKPKVACISPVEVVNSKIQSSVDADLLSREYIFENAIVEGPLSFDIAVSKKAGDIKGVNSLVAGDADILLLPNIDAGNTLYKSLTVFGNGNVAGVVAGLKIPVILTSRADSVEAKINSLKLALDMIN